jgi:GAF domain-containing protein
MPDASPDHLVAVVSAALADPGPDDRELLVSTVDMVRTIFAAVASSIFLRSADGQSLTFEVVSGAGADHLVGTSMPADRGIAGWVAAAGEPMIVQNTHADPRFAADVAQLSGYVPSVIMAVPVRYADEVLGVLEVLDPQRAQPGIDDLDLLTMLAAHAGLTLRGLLRHRTARAALADHGSRYADLAEMVGTFERLDKPRREAGLALLDAMHTLLAT